MSEPTTTPTSQTNLSDTPRARDLCRVVARFHNPRPGPGRRVRLRRPARHSRRRSGDLLARPVPRRNRQQDRPGKRDDHLHHPDRGPAGHRPALWLDRAGPLHQGRHVRRGRGSPVGNRRTGHPRRERPRYRHAGYGPVRRRYIDVPRPDGGQAPHLASSHPGRHVGRVAWDQSRPGVGHDWPDTGVPGRQRWAAPVPAVDASIPAGRISVPAPGRLAACPGTPVHRRPADPRPSRRCPFPAVLRVPTRRSDGTTPGLPGPQAARAAPVARRRPPLTPVTLLTRENSDIRSGSANGFPPRSDRPPGRVPPAGC